MKTVKLFWSVSLRRVNAWVLGVLALAVGAVPASARTPGLGGTEFDLGDVQGHVDIPEIAGVPGSGVPWFWPPDALEATSPGDEWDGIRPGPSLAPLPPPGELPRDPDVLIDGNGPQQMLPAVLLPGAVAPGDGTVGTGSSIPSPGSGALIGVALVLTSRRRR